MSTQTDVLVSTDWLAEHLDDPDVIVVDVDEDLGAYGTGHIPGAVGFDWTNDFRHPLRRTFLDREGFEQLLNAKGVERDAHVVLYGGNSNWFAAYAYWYFRVYGHDRLSLLDGGRAKWQAEGRPLVEDVEERPATDYKASEADESIRLRRDEVLERFVGAPAGVGLVDVRSPAEFSGEALAPAHLPGEAAQVPGHIPGARNVPWAKAVDPDTNAFLPVEELEELYRGQGLEPDQEIATYCRIGERSAHSWFVLHELLGWDQVRNYDGSWTEYGSLIDVPVER